MSGSADTLLWSVDTHLHSLTRMVLEEFIDEHSESHSRACRAVQNIVDAGTEASPRVRDWLRAAVPAWCLRSTVPPVHEGTRSVLSLYYTTLKASLQRTKRARAESLRRQEPYPSNTRNPRADLAWLDPMLCTHLYDRLREDLRVNVDQSGRAVRDGAVVFIKETVDGTGRSYVACPRAGGMQLYRSVADYHAKERHVAALHASKYAEFVMVGYSPEDVEIELNGYSARDRARHCDIRILERRRTRAAVATDPSLKQAAEATSAAPDFSRAEGQLEDSPACNVNPFGVAPTVASKTVSVATAAPPKSAAKTSGKRGVNRGRTKNPWLMQQRKFI